MIAAEGMSIAGAIGTVAGGITGAALILTTLAKVPGGKWLFARLVVEPARQMVRDVMTAEIDKAVDRRIGAHVAPLVDAIESVNVAVNHVAPGSPPLKDRVARIEEGQVRIEGQLSIIRGVVERLVERP